MGLLECASGASRWRGYEYYQEKKVTHLEEIAEGVYRATVLGSGDAAYSVEMNLPHPRKSSCTCPHAAGRRVICKHIVAVYFTLFPEEAERFYTEVMAYEEEEEKRQEMIVEKVEDCVLRMKKAELQNLVLDLLFDGPDWQYERFVRENGLDDWEWEDFDEEWDY